MTREEHIERLKAIREYCCAQKDRESMDFAIESLEAEARREAHEKWLRDEEDDPNAGKYYGDI